MYFLRVLYAALALCSASVSELYVAIYTSWSSAGNRRF